MNIESLRKDMVAAMKAKDKERKEAISSLVSAAKKAGIPILLAPRGELNKKALSRKAIKKKLYLLYLRFS